MRPVYRLVDRKGDLMNLLDKAGEKSKKAKKRSGMNNGMSIPEEMQVNVKIVVQQ
jgi:hypothetical protein